MWETFDTQEDGGDVLVMLRKMPLVRLWRNFVNVGVNDNQKCLISSCLSPSLTFDYHSLVLNISNPASADLIRLKVSEEMHDQRARASA